MSHPLPEAFLKNMQEMLGDEYPAFLRALDLPPALALRLNPKRAGAEAAAGPYIDGPVPWAEWGRYLVRDEALKPGGSVAHAAGAFYLQEASAMASAAVLDARPGERVLDLCAAPGGKSTQIAAALGDAGLLVSNDPEPARAKALAGNLERMGAANALVVSALPDRLAGAGRSASTPCWWTPPAPARACSAGTPPPGTSGAPPRRRAAPSARRRSWTRRRCWCAPAGGWCTPPAPSTTWKTRAA